MAAKYLIEVRGRYPLPLESGEAKGEVWRIGTIGDVLERLFRRLAELVARTGYVSPAYVAGNPVTEDEYAAHFLAALHVHAVVSARPSSTCAVLARGPVWKGVTRLRAL